MNYTDDFGRYHNKPVTEKDDTPCNNAWIFSAYAKKIGLEVNLDADYALYCSIDFTRHKDDYTPPFSRDEVLGMVYLGYLSRITMDWYFHKVKPPKFNLLKTVASFILMAREHRNYFWMNNLTHVYRFTFTVPLTDRAFIYKEIYGEAPWYYRLIAWFDSKLKPSGDSGALIRWLKYNKMPEIGVFERTFGLDHPITIKAREI